MQSLELALPCPFCGDQPAKVKYSGDERNGYADTTVYCCRGCGARVFTVGIPGKKTAYADNSTVDERALAKWNKRAPA